MELVDHLTYHERNILLTEIDVIIPIEKFRQVIDYIETHAHDEIKREFFQAVAVSVVLHGRTTWTLMPWEKKKRLQIDTT